MTMLTMSNYNADVADVRNSRFPPLQRVGPSVPVALDSSIQAHLGQHLRAWYDDPAETKLPHTLTRLIDRLAQAIRARTEPVNQAFTDEVLASVTSLRAFAISLTRDADQAEDLVQETVLRAISKQEQFVAGTNLQAWLFTILRNLFCSACRRTKREVEDAGGTYAATLTAIPDHEGRTMLKELSAALAKLPEGQRKAIMLVGAEGMSYEAAAQALGCAVGTIQSRVNLARNRLAELMGLERREQHRRGASQG
jgi:RNA polymerase sigma-70 factor (ECF subfamily)